MPNTKQSEPDNRKQINTIRTYTAPKIHTNKEYENLVPSTTKEVFQSLICYMRESGQLEPITINNIGEVLDGHNRLKICEKLHIKTTF